MTYEKRDASIRGILIFMVVITVLLVFSFAAMFAFYRVMEAGDKGSVRETPWSTDENLPPEPRLQSQPSKDLKELREREDKRLTSYGWVNRNNGIVHIPIEHAMRLVIQKGLPSRKK
jgi:hypothetical protein